MKTAEFWTMQFVYIFLTVQCVNPYGTLNSGGVSPRIHNLGTDGEEG